jgi:transposase-like protein
MKRLNQMNTGAAGKTPQKHSLELKISVARQVIEEHKSGSELARETSIAPSNVHKWVNQARRGELEGYTVPTFDAQHGDLAAEVKRLTRALAEMTAQRDFLKKTTVFFAKGPI